MIIVTFKLYFYICDSSIGFFINISIVFLLGFCVYFFYGMWNSSERKPNVGATDVYVVDKNEGQLIAKGLNTNTMPSGKSSVESNMSELMSSCNSVDARLISDHPSNTKI